MWVDVKQACVGEVNERDKMGEQGKIKEETREGRPAAMTRHSQSPEVMEHSVCY